VGAVAEWCYLMDSEACQEMIMKMCFRLLVLRRWLGSSGSLLVA
jgi:hypothetical protein